MTVLNGDQPEMFDDKWKHQKCPYCLRNCTIEPNWQWLTQMWDSRKGYFSMTYTCPNHECRKQVIFIALGNQSTAMGSYGPTFVLDEVEQISRVVPPGAARPPAPSLVPENLAADYDEACLVLPYSAKASSALSRRCLQYMLRKYVGVKPARLVDEIDEVISSGYLPSHIRKPIDVIRNYGKFAAHPIDSEKTGELIEVEAGEAEWTLDVLEALFDFYFVQPQEVGRKAEKASREITSLRFGRVKGLGHFSFIWAVSHEVMRTF